MDDYLHSFPTTQKSINRCREIIKTLSSGAFKLTKSVSNSPKFLKKLLPHGASQKHSIVDLDLQNTPTQRTLGVLWDTENGLLRVKIIQRGVPVRQRGLVQFLTHWEFLAPR